MKGLLLLSMLALSAQADDHTFHVRTARLYDFSLQDTWSGKTILGLCHEQDLARDPLGSMKVRLPKDSGGPLGIVFGLGSPRSCAHLGFNLIEVKFVGNARPELAGAVVSLATAEFNLSNLASKKVGVNSLSEVHTYAAFCSGYTSGTFFVDYHLFCELADHKGTLDLVLE